MGATGFATLGAGLIAITFGLARYAFGLFVPSIRAELGLSAELVGVVGSLAFISFCLASVIAPIAADRLGARYAATVSGLLALAGLTLISQAHDAISLGIGVFACGISTELMMPALSAGVQVAVRPCLQGRVNAVMNAGTSVGLILCVPAVLLVSDAWRAAYVSFAALAAVGVGAATALVAARPGELWIALVSAAVFGWAFMTLSGLYLVSGIRLLRERPSTGPAVAFLAITVGQAVGSPLVGWTIDRTSYAEAFVTFATLALVLAAASPLFPRTSDQGIAADAVTPPLTAAAAASVVAEAERTRP